MTALRLRGTLLPSGEVRELWLLGDRITFTRPAGQATTVVDGGFLIPGLVDAHTHPGHDGDARFTDRQFAAECAEHVAAGTLALRVPGHNGPIPPERRRDPSMPRLITAGHALAWAGLNSDAPIHTIIDDLVPAAVAEAAANDRWCKLIADWEPGAPPVPLELMRAAVDAVHATGGRVAAHCQTADGTRHAVLAGVDSIEHGWFLTDDLVDLLAGRAGAFTPTATGFLPHLDVVRTKPEGPRKDWFLSGFASLSRAVVTAAEAGVRVLAGTDSTPFGNVLTEVRWLVDAGLSAEAALAAGSWGARSYLGLPGLEEGGLGDVVAYEVDPRATPAALAHPSRIILRGRVVR